MLRLKFCTLKSNIKNRSVSSLRNIDVSQQGTVVINIHYSQKIGIHRRTMELGNKVGPLGNKLKSGILVVKINHYKAFSGSTLLEVDTIDAINTASNSLLGLSNNSLVGITLLGSYGPGILA